MFLFRTNNKAHVDSLGFRLNEDGVHIPFSVDFEERLQVLNE